MTKGYKESEFGVASLGAIPIVGAGIGTRIGEAANALGDRKSAAGVMGVSVDQLQRYIREENQAPFLAIAKLAITSGYSMTWLATGLGEKLESSQHSELGDYALIPRYNVHATGGDGGFIGEEEIVGWLAFSRAWLQKEGLDARFLKVIDYTGYSMEPTIRHGSILLVDVSRTHPAHDQIFLLRVDDHLVAKRLQHNFSLGGGLIIHSDNPDYKDQEVPPERVSELNIVAAVVWVGGRV